jgi:5-methylcytosine-specific restriction endonuclease McrA
MGGRRYKTDEQRRKARCENFARWLAKPGNLKKHREAVKKCRQRPHAKEAHRKRALKYAAQNREQERLRAAEWRKNNPEKDRQMRRDYYVRNAEKVKAATRAFRLANLKLFQEYSRQYKASRRAGGGRLSRGYVKKLMAMQASRCNACQADLVICGFHLDHIVPISRGGLHCDENVQLLCPTCNRRKSAKNFEDFLAQLKKEAA